MIDIDLDALKKAQALAEHPPNWAKKRQDYQPGYRYRWQPRATPVANTVWRTLEAYEGVTVISLLTMSTTPRDTRFEIFEVVLQTDDGLTIINGVAYNHGNDWFSPSVVLFHELNELLKDRPFKPATGNQHG
jgi:hypothetical protein